MSAHNQFTELLKHDGAPPIIEPPFEIKVSIPYILFRKKHSHSFLPAKRIYTYLLSIIVSGENGKHYPSVYVCIQPSSSSGFYCFDNYEPYHWVNNSQGVPRYISLSSVAVESKYSPDDFRSKLEAILDSQGCKNHVNMIHTAALRQFSFTTILDKCIEATMHLTKSIFKPWENTSAAFGITYSAANGDFDKSCCTSRTIAKTDTEIAYELIVNNAMSCKYEAPHDGSIEKISFHL